MSEMKEVSHKFSQQTRYTLIKYKFILYLDMLIAYNFIPTFYSILSLKYICGFYILHLSEILGSYDATRSTDTEQDPPIIPQSRGTVAESTDS